jgi:hypothetical protein
VEFNLPGLEQDPESLPLDAGLAFHGFLNLRLGSHSYVRWVRTFGCSCEGRSFKQIFPRRAAHGKAPTVGTLPNPSPKRKGRCEYLRKSLIPWAADADMSLGQNASVPASKRGVSKGLGRDCHKQLILQGELRADLALPNREFWRSSERVGTPRGILGRTSCQVNVNPGIAFRTGKLLHPPLFAGRILGSARNQVNAHRGYMGKPPSPLHPGWHVRRNACASRKGNAV